MLFFLRASVCFPIIVALGCEQIPEIDYSVYPDWTSSRYILPYPIGSSFEVAQGNHSPASGDVWTSHRWDGPLAYAYDFFMPIGSPVIAVRAGKVIWIVEQYSDDENAADQGNGLAIVHEDGSLAVYGHLTRNGVLVELGDHVEQGEKIALSGCSGASPVPHLHFHVSPTAREVNSRSIPITFRNTTPNPQGLKIGEEYPALAY